jgi:hypothetical protein
MIGQHDVGGGWPDALKALDGHAHPCDAQPGSILLDQAAASLAAPGPTL